METFIRQYNIDPKLCDKLIKYYKNNSEYKSIGEHLIAETQTLGIDKKAKDSIDVTFFNSSQNKTIKVKESK